MNKKDLPVIPPNRADDLHGLEIAEKADLVLFMAGNQFMAMKEIVAEFKTQYPEVKNIFLDFILSEKGQQIYKKYGFLSGSR